MLSVTTHPAPLEPVAQSPAPHTAVPDSVPPQIESSDPDAGPRLSLLPSPGTHWIHWRPARFARGVLIRVQRERERGLMDGAAMPGAGPFETLTLNIVGRRAQLLQRLVQEARDEAAAADAGKLLIYTAWGSEWRPFGLPRAKRPLPSVVLAPGLATDILADVEEFLASSTWYQQRGIPYRRGYLLEGPPGTGKSSFVQALAAELGYSICVLNLAEGMLTDDRLAHLLNTLPDRAFLLLEDIDAAVARNADALTADRAARFAHGSSAHLSLSGLLNALDGVVAAEERVIFMTTNHLAHLDPALLRPGRIDRILRFGLALPQQAVELFRNFYPDADAAMAAALGPLVREYYAAGGAGISPAAIQGHFIMHKDAPQQALDQFARLFQAPRPARTAGACN